MTAITKPLTEWNNKEILIFLYKTKVLRFINYCLGAYIFSTACDCYQYFIHPTVPNVCFGTVWQNILHLCVYFSAAAMIFMMVNLVLSVYLLKSFKCRCVGLACECLSFICFVAVLLNNAIAETAFKRAVDAVRLSATASNIVQKHFAADLWENIITSSFASTLITTLLLLVLKFVLNYFCGTREPLAADVERDVDMRAAAYLKSDSRNVSTEVYTKAVVFAVSNIVLKIVLCAVPINCVFEELLYKYVPPVLSGGLNEVPSCFFTCASICIFVCITACVWCTVPDFISESFSRTYVKKGFILPVKYSVIRRHIKENQRRV